MTYLRLNRLLPWLVLAAGLVVTYFLQRAAFDDARQMQRDNFAYQEREIALRIEQRLAAYEQVLRGVKGLFISSQDVERDEFHNYVAGLRLENHFPGIQGVGFSRIVPPQEKARHIQAIRNEGFPDYTLRPEGERDLYTAIIYLEPFAGRNLRAFGYDMYSEAVRRAAMEQARDLDKPVMSGKVTLVQEAGQIVQAGFLMYLPVYRNGSPHETLAERRANIFGWVYLPFRMDDLMVGILGEQVNKVDLHIFDGKNISSETLMYDNDGDFSLHHADKSLYHATRRIEILGHTWTTSLRSLHPFEANIDTGRIKAIQMTGISLSALLSLLVWLLASGRTRALRLAQEHRIAATAFEVQEGMLITDADGLILRVNRAFSNITGYAAKEVIGKNTRILSSGRQDANFYAAMWKSINETGAWEGEIWNRRKNGEIYPEYLTISAVKGESGAVTNYVATLNDITESKKAEIAIAANRAKSDFLANMSHEIRTPMNGVIGMVDILQQTELNPAQLRMVNTIQDSSLDLLNILNDILDFSKIEAGKLEVERIPIPLREVIEGTAQLMFASADAKSIELHTFVSPRLPQWIASDPSRLRQVLLNLLGNAVKFTSSEDGRPGQVLLCAEPAILADGRAGVHLRVSDNGIGMSTETLEKLYQPFTQADESMSRKFGGTGLGLSITRRLVELMGGRISVRSMLGEGSEFTIELPLEETAPGRQAAPDPDLTGVHVLAVTTNAECKQILQSYCRAGGADVSVVTELAAARSQLRQMQASLGTNVLLLDIDVTAEGESGLPDNVGVVQLVRRGRSIHSDKIVTVLALPLLYHDLIHGVAIASGRLVARASAALTDRRLHTRNQVPTVEVSMAANRLILLAEDNETNREVILEQLHLLGYSAEVAEDGVVALNMWRTGRYALLLTDCHMPNMDGFELTAAIRTESMPGMHLPIIAVTANALQGEAERCIEHGMDDYLSKPLRLDELGTMLAKWLPLPEAPTTDDTAATDPGSKLGRPALRTAEFSVWDAAVLTRMVGDNPARHRRLLEKFLANAQGQVADILSAATAGDCTAAGSVAHSLKSAARTVGAMQLGELCHAMEVAGKAGDGETCSALAEDLNRAFEAAAEKIRQTFN